MESFNSFFFKNYLYKIKLISSLIDEVDNKYLYKIIFFNIFSSLLEITNIGILIPILFGSKLEKTPFIYNFQIKEGLLIIFLLTIFKGLLNKFVLINQENIKNKLTDNLKEETFRKILFSGGEEIRNFSKGELHSLLINNINRTVVVLDQFIRILKYVISITIYFIGILILGKSSILPLIIALFSTLFAALIIPSESWTFGKMQTNINAIMQKTIGDSLQGMKDVRAASAENWLLQKYASQNNAIRNVLFNTVKKVTSFDVLRDSFIVGFVSLWFLFFINSIDKIKVIAILLFSYKGSNYLSSLIFSYRLMINSLSGYENLKKIRSKLGFSANKILENSHKLISINSSNKIHWELVNKEKNIFLNKIDLKINSITIIVGNSGSGKTSLLDSFCGLDNAKNSIWEIEYQKKYRKNIKINFNNLSKFIAYAPQNPFLFEASIYENIFFEPFNENRKDCFSKIKLLNKWLKYLKLEKNFDENFKVTDDFNLSLNRFSEGEVQRLGLIRAWIRNKKVEVLDEPTAYLDNEMSSIVRKIILQRSKNKFILITSHDHELIKLGSQVLKIK